MPYLVNGQLVPEELIREESKRLERDVYFQNIADEAQRAGKLRAAAEGAAIDKILIAQAAASDPRPIDPAAIRQEVERQKTQWGRRSILDDIQLRQWVESQFRLQRVRHEMVGDTVKPTAEDLAAFYRTHRENFGKPEMFRASHIVKHVNHEQSEEQAEAGIQAALAELERGVPFAEVAGRYSDCKDKGGDLGEFTAGHMVDDFEAAIRALEPGQRTGIFTTPFGFHIALLHGKTPAGQAGLEDVRTGIERVLTYAAEHEAYRRSIGDGLLRPADVGLFAHFSAVHRDHVTAPGVRAETAIHLGPVHVRSFPSG